MLHSFRQYYEEKEIKMPHRETGESVALHRSNLSLVVVCDDRAQRGRLNHISNLVVSGVAWGRV